ncbi:MAG: ribosome maturation factor RimM [Coprothermobacterota bacterium]|nr:ribosome maturation factor RimM [Coprothermobacterota bacterium]
MKFGENPIRICVGKIIKPHGVCGWLKVQPFARPERFGEIGRVFLKEEARTIEGIKMAGAYVLLKLEGITDRNQGEEFVGASIYIPLNERPALPEGQYYIDDLKGCRVITVSGELIGELFEIWSLPANDVFLVKSPEEKVLMVPALKEVVREINLETKTILVEDRGVVR